MSALERAKYAYEKLKTKRTAGGNHGKLRSQVVREYVLTKLFEEHRSPEEIAGRILIDVPGESIAPQTIYNFIKYERSDLRRFLMERGKPRRQRVAHRRGRFRQGAPIKRSIHERPKLIDNRDEAGHVAAPFYAARECVRARKRGRFGCVYVQVHGHAAACLVLPAFPSV